MISIKIYITHLTNLDRHNAKKGKINLTKNILPLNLLYKSTF